MAKASAPLVTQKAHGNPPSRVARTSLTSNKSKSVDLSRARSSLIAALGRRVRRNHSERRKHA